MRKIVGIEMIKHPCNHGGSSNLSVGQDGYLYSTWLEYIDDSVVELNYAKLQDHAWLEAIPISRGHNWFSNWADFPSVAVTSKFKAAHWLEYRGTGVYEYDVKMALSDDGYSWQKPFTPHRDEIKAEHGFVSMLPINAEEIIAFWLDGRNTAGDQSEKVGHDHGHSGAMTLRTATINKNGSLGNEFELDNLVCDCCQTSAALTKTGPVVVYRNRTPDEIRDIYIVRQVEGRWQEPHPVYVDGWKIGGCPVNGPAITTLDRLVAVIWYTMADDQAQVKLAFSKDDGANFGEPLIISEHLPMGRVDVEFIDSENVIVTWLENKTDDTSGILAKLINLEGIQSEAFSLASSTSQRASGFPRLAILDKKIYLSWTALNGELSSINTAEILLKS